MSERRIVFVDAARGLAVVLALFIHSLAVLGPWATFGPIPRALVRSCTNAATPTFIVLFGAMLEMVYYRALLREGPARVRARLLRRSVNCYAGYLAIVAAGLVSGRRSLVDALAAGLAIGDARYGNILKFYAFALLVAVPLLALRRRRGLGVTVALGLGLWAIVPCLDLVPWPNDSSPFSYLTGTLVGRPIGASWISLLHSEALVVVGMVIGWSLGQGIDRQRWTLLYRTLGCVLAACVTLAAVLVLQTSVREVAGDYLTMQYRLLHHVGYYGLGLLQATALIAAMALLLPPRMPYTPRLVPILTLGRSSLLSFTLGNCLLTLWPLQRHLSVPTGLALSAFVPGISLVLVFAIEAVLYERPVPATAGRPAVVLAGSRDG